MVNKYMKILIAEDEPSISLILKITLEDRGHQVTTTADGEECLKAYSDEQLKLASISFEHTKPHQPYDTIVLDYRMPKMDGIQVAKEILKINPKQRIIFASAYAASILQELAKYLNGDTQVIQKPFEPDEFAEMVDGGNLGHTTGHEENTNSSISDSLFVR